MKLRAFLLAAFLPLLTLSAWGEQVVFSEVMYNPPAGKPEFIEITNLTNTPLDMALWRMSEGVDFQFPNFNSGDTQAHFLKPMEVILLSATTEALTRAAYPSIPAGVRIFGPWTGSLDNNGERLTLKDKNGIKVCTLDYGTKGRWSRAADGAGHSLVLGDDLMAIDDWRVWRASVNTGGSPGVADPAYTAPALSLSEAHFGAGTSTIDWIELRNGSGSAASASGLYLTSKSTFSNKVALSGTVAAGGYASFAVSFAASGSGDLTLYLVDGSNNVLDSVRLQRVTGRDSMQQYPAGKKEWYSSVSATQGAANNPDRFTDIVINEIMADPPSDQRDGEFIELYNRGAAAVNVGGWQLDEAVGYAIPPGTVIPAGGYLVVAANATHLNSCYSGLAAIGNWSGSLSNSGDRVRLIDANGNLADEVDYRFGGEWPSLAAGNGSSLELVNPGVDNDFGSAWRDSDESQKSAFTTFTINGGNYKNLPARSVSGTLTSYYDPELFLWAVGDSHFVMRNLVLRPTAGGSNVLVNGEVTTLLNENVAGWQSRGTHWASYHDAEGVHLVADGHGDNKANHMRKDAAALVANTDYTLTFEARWVWGKPRLIAQTWDATWGGTVLLPIPQNLGTPGAVNSTGLAAAPPQVGSGSHSPAVPTTSTTAVTVTAKVSAAGSPLSAVEVCHRLDSSTNTGSWSVTAMNDSGTGGDAVAGDGIYSALITLASFTGYASNGAKVQFYVRATGTNAASSEFPRGGASRPGMWVVDNNSRPTDLRRMRVVVSNYWLRALSQTDSNGGNTAFWNYKFPRMSNEYVPCTAVHNDSVVYYGATVRKTSSVFNRTTDNFLSMGRLDLAEDRPFRGKTKFYWSGSTNLNDRVVRYFLYLLGVPGNQNEICRVTRNNDGYAVSETSEHFDKEMLDRLYENGSQGQFLEIDYKTYIGTDGSSDKGHTHATWAYNPADSPGATNPVSYHNQFTPKSREWEYDYSSFIEWCRRISANGTSQEKNERIADTQAMAAYAAVRGYVADWDSLTIISGRNGYMYQRPTDRKWMMLHWDSELTFSLGKVNEAVIGGRTNVGTYFGRPFVRRYVNHFLYQLMTTYSPDQPRVAAWLAAEEAASGSYSVGSYYSTWPTSGRYATIESFIGSTSLGAVFALTNPPATATTETVNITGTATLEAFRVECVGHPEAVFKWTTSSSTNVSPWSLSNIQLVGGVNALTFRMLDQDGNQVGSTLSQTVTKSGNALPVIALACDPASQNVGLGQSVTLSAAGTYDPENAGALSYSWSVLPASGFTVTADTGGTRKMTFSAPGSYTVTLTVTDGDGQSASRSLDLGVCNNADFDNFSANTLTGYTLQGLKLRDNYAPDAWYSLNETTGKLVIQVLDSAARPLTTTSPSFPKVSRALPASADFTLQTDVTLETVKYGAFLTGLHVETVEDGVTTRYGFGLSAGANLLVQRASGPTGTYDTVSTTTYSGGDLVLRVLRSGNGLSFQRRVSGLWTNLYTQTLPAGTTATEGAIFVSTTSAENVRAAFDYLLVGDPGNSSDLFNSLRITEVMYDPPAGGVEFIELQNRGIAPLNLEGAYFPDGSPFSSRFTFGALTLQPGQYCVVTNDIAAFQARYGTGVTIAGQFVGVLDNAGETITIKDVNANTILTFSYGTATPWPASNGTGKSLEFLGSGMADYSNPEMWRSSQEDGGAPGYEGLATDSDGDGVPDAVELAYGSNAASAASQPTTPATSRNAVSGAVTLTWASQAGRNYTVQYRSGWTGSWSDLGTVQASGPSATYTDSGAAGQGARFYRVSTSFP